MKTECRHLIAGTILEVTMAHFRHQDKIILLNDDNVACDSNRDKSSLLKLNNDCILAILSVKCLSAIDLCSVAGTCHRLKEIACQVFKRKYKSCDLKALVADEIDFNCYNGGARAEQRIIMNFGSLISDLRMKNYFRNANLESIFDYVAKYCCNTLVSLNMHTCVIPENCTAKLRPLFKNLQKLTIERCTFDGSSKKLFADCGSLVELELSDGDYAFIVENTFSNLQTFRCYIEAPHKRSQIISDSFILRHQNLKLLRMWNSMDVSSLLQLIADNCKRLEDLECSIIGSLDLSNFGHLRKLKIDCKYRSVMAVQGWNNLTFLESLSLYYAEVDSQLIPTLSQLQSLQVLRLHKWTGHLNLNQLVNLHQLTELKLIRDKDDLDLDLVLLIKRLQNLKVLTIKVRQFEFDLNMYLRIVDVVKERPDKSKLTFKLCLRSHHFDICNYDKMRPDIFNNAHIVEMVTCQQVRCF